jgi:outer membrane immunogenic protein
MRSIVGSTFFTAAILAVTFQGETRAADNMPAAMPYKAAPIEPVWSWSGFYVGGGVGGAWGTRDVTLNTIDGTPCHFCNDGSAVFTKLDELGTATNLKNSSAAFDLNAGYNAQFGMWVLGLEGDATSFRLRSSVTSSGNPFINFPGFANFSTNISTDWVATVRPRIGYAFDKVLVYATGGVAFGRVAISQSHSDFAPVGIGVAHEASSVSSVKTGWTAGGGVEYALTRNWIVNTEYLYANLGSLSTSGTVTDQGPSNALLTFTSRTTVNQVRAGLSYKF